MTRKPWKEPTLDDLLADPILDLLLASDRVNREELLAVVEHARRALAGAAGDRVCQVREPVCIDAPTPRLGTDKTGLYLSH